jgi:hypothetical protein
MRSAPAFINKNIYLLKWDTAVNRANFSTLNCIKMSLALNTSIGIDKIYIIARCN